MLKKASPQWLGVVCVVGALHLATVSFAHELMQAKIGIRVVSGATTKHARTKDKLNKSDKLRIFIEPQANAYVYVVHEDDSAINLLAKLSDEQALAQDTVVLPSKSEFYEIDGRSAFEKLTIVCSPTPLSEIEALFAQSNPAPAAWQKTELALRKQSLIDLNENTDKPFGIAGNVRDIEDDQNRVVAGLTLYSGKSLVLKRYEFRVKK